MSFFKHHKLAAWGKEALYICAMKLDSATHLINSRNRLRLCQSALTEAESVTPLTEKQSNWEWVRKTTPGHQHRFLINKSKSNDSSSHPVRGTTNSSFTEQCEGVCDPHGNLLHLTKGRTGGERNLLTPRPPLMNMPNNRKTVLLNSGQPTVQLGPKNF